MDEVIRKIDVFKEKYPLGSVITTVHTGVDFAYNLAQKRQVDLILNAHEHKNGTQYVNGVPIVELSQNFLDIINVKIIKDDEGKTSAIEIKTMHPKDGNYKPGEIEELRKTIFKEDLKKKYRITPQDDSISLNMKNVRNSNSHLANLITDSILDEIKQIDDSVQIFALNASSIRGGFELEEGKAGNVCFFELSNCLDGLSSEQANVFVNEISGQKLAYLVLDNFSFNEIDTEKNPIIHYSGLKIDKKGFMEASKQGASYRELCQFMTLEETGEPINPNQTYKIANVEKYFIKSKDEKIKSMINDAYPLDLSARQAFENHFKKNDEVIYKPKTRF